MQDKSRNFGVDFLKVLLALMVISIHFGAGGTGRVWENCHVMPMRLFMIIVDAFTLPAVNCYILITSYFLYESGKDYKWVIHGLARIWIALLTYSVCGYLFVILISSQTFNIFHFAKRFFPIISGEWWFMSNYFALMLLAPFLLEFVKKISIGKHRLLIILSFTGCSIFPFFTKGEECLGVNNGYSLLWFIVLFFVGTYLKRENIRRDIYGGGICLVCYLICGVLLQAIPFISNRISFMRGMNVSSYNSFVLCLESIFLFLAFLSIRTPAKGGFMVSKLASLSMASYIFHCQEDISSYIWEILHPWTYANTYYLFAVYFLVIFGLYTISVIIEALRRKLMSVGNLQGRLVEIIYRCVEKTYRCIDNMIVGLLEKQMK